MEVLRRAVLAAGIALAAVTAAEARVACGGRFADFVQAMKAEAVASGHGRQAADAFFGAARHDDRVIRADRSQGIFRKDFIEFARLIISQSRLVNGRRNAERHAAVFDAAARRYGVSRGVLLAFWALLVIPLAGLPVFWIARRTLAHSQRLRRSGYVLFDVILQILPMHLIQISQEHLALV